MTRHSLTFQNAPPPDPRLFRRALGQFPTGVTVITTRTPDGQQEGMTANSFSALSLNPPLVLWSIRNQAPSFAAFQEAGVFAINILTQDQAALSHHFATPKINKFEGIAHTQGHGGCPILADTLAQFECDLAQIIPAGDHHIMIGQVHRASFDDSASPLLFSGGRYAIAAALPNVDATRDLTALWEGLG
ncbi:flavin reductase family protein [Roseicitreum antarcticum]|uniref:NADH-FMN oxidoreductase RutF, flavin reductase (DIM6/NTAB) family n=1 Tax=Roseicitreum antarcticum TaxID=564137 RepID=A0A1H3AJP0_9RHOB|nr:flavin reductase family protein [Roseicitreum antarcticum]SDX29661.1 NADH-FMN oxidoreductase RutF, flavin reductase (DIM6/NTAB) family [Roseicitreum antarcticum]